MEKSKEAFERHGGPKATVRHEVLVADTLGEMRRVCFEVGVPDGGLDEAVENSSSGSVTKKTTTGS